MSQYEQLLVLPHCYQKTYATEESESICNVFQYNVDAVLKLESQVRNNLYKEHLKYIRDAILTKYIHY